MSYLSSPISWPDLPQTHSILEVFNRAFILATDIYKHSYGDDGAVDGNGSSQDHNEKDGSDVEAGPLEGKVSIGKDDLFGDETSRAQQSSIGLSWW